MFELIIKDIMEVAGYLPIGILCGCIAAWFISCIQ